MNLAVDVISDVICPWCYIGKRRMEKAVAAVEKAESVETLITAALRKLAK